MKKIFLLICLFFFFLGGQVSASRELEDYQFQLDKYRENYVSFSNARDKYLKYQTLESRKEASEATQEVLLWRTRVFKTYFILVNLRLRDIPRIAQSTREEFDNLLQAKISWLTNHETVLNSLSSPTLEELFALSKETEQKELEMKRLVAQVEGLVYLGKVKDLEESCKTFDEGLKEKEKTESAIFQQWFSQVEQRFTSLEEELQQAEEEWQFLSNEKVDDEKDINKTFLRLRGNLIQSQAYLEEIITFQKEINKKIESET